MSLFRAIKKQIRVNRARQEIERRQITPREHGLDAPLIVSLTSFPQRFDVLPLTLKSLLRQTIKPDMVMLWIAHDDFEQLPDTVLELRSQGLKIRQTENFKSYKKLIPALREIPNAYIATADDDLYYPPNWLEGLVNTAVGYPGRVIANRAHRISYQSDGQMESYEHWKKNISGSLEGPEIFATGNAGVLYPPGSLHPDVLRSDFFMSLCPNADDLWFYWMARRQGSIVRHIGGRWRLIEWPDSQEKNLRSINLGTPGESGNDRAIAALSKHFGPYGEA